MVSLDGSMQYNTIQSAINASSDGDTVLVYPGRYLENIIFNGRNIFLSSLYCITPADSLIQNTIIDGNHNGSCVRVINGETLQATINGFTIVNGTGTVFRSEISGGGFYVNNSTATISNCIINNNYAFTAGGGVYVCGTMQEPGKAFLSNNIISNNIAFCGGGIVVTYYSSIELDSLNVNSIYNNHAGYANDLCIYNRTNSYNIVLDTMTVDYKDADYIFVNREYNLRVNHSTLQSVNHDLYVSPFGNDNNTGFSFAEPLQTLYKAFEIIASDSLNPKSVYLSPGVYSRSLNNQRFPVNLKGHVSLIGAGKDVCIIDAEEQGGILVADEDDDYITIGDLSINNASHPIGDAYYPFSTVIILLEPREVIIKNCNFLNTKTYTVTRSPFAEYLSPNTSLTIENILIEGDCLTQTGLMSVNNLKFKNVILKNNYGINADDFGYLPFSIGNSPLDDWRANIQVSNMLIENHHNYIANWPVLLVSSAMILKGYSDFIFSNLTITNNTAVPDGGIISTSEGGANARFYNCLFYGNSPSSIWMRQNTTPDQPNHLYFNNCLVEDGESAIHYLHGEGVYNFAHWGENNLNTNPLFVNEGEFPYALSPGSPCIDAGTTNIEGFIFPETDLAGNPRISGQQIDIGAYEYQQRPVDFSAYPTSGTAPLSVQFTDQSDQNASSWKWDFNNDGVWDSFEQHPLHIYTQSGIYSVRLTINDGEGTYLKENYINVTLGNEQNPELLKNEISAPYPNPFQFKTVIKMQNKEQAHVKVEIFNIKGQKVKTLFDAKTPKSTHEMIWEAVDSKGKRVSSGIYTAVMKVNNKIVSTQKLTVLK